ncbi:recombinase RecT [Leifsonia sp. ZF2019]|uniref:recombinase RecT n=1 Tax=Leifsonia sp. ZF2019 TaxID=2781978 RepID=UPI001CBAD30C|nr:recombinase RecT [Leifsonia sp. ZF2019]UAJ80185.1 recombinase RecT [Leifsonia sp. ZF2019]
MTTDLARIEDDPAGQALFERREDFVRFLGGEQQAERFIQEAFSALNANPFLRRCTPSSLFGALYFAAQIDLPVGGPMQQFHLTPRQNWNAQRGEKEWQVVPVVGYNGLITLAMNTGEYDAIEGKLVYENDDVDLPWDDETGTHFKLRPAPDGARGELRGVIGRALVKGADRSLIEWLDIETIRDRMRPSNWAKTPWATDEAAMVKKTGIRRVSKYTAKSRDSWKFALALDADQAVVNLDELGELAVDRREPATEDWKSIILATTDKADLEREWKRLVASQAREVIDEFRPLVAAHGGTLTVDSRSDRPSPAELAAAAVGHEAEPDEPSEEEFLRREAAEYEAAVARGEVQP